MVITRRTAVVGSLAALATARSFATAASDVDAQLAYLERASGGRLGVAILDTSNGARFGHRADERFAMCSTFKCLAAAHVLARVDNGEEHLDRRITYTAKDLLSYAPVTKDHLADGMTLAELCEAAITQSDNTAANLILSTFGGPQGWTAYARSLGDRVSRLDRTEPDLNRVDASSELDTTTPNAMLDDLRKIILGDALSSASRDRLIAWLVANKTGDAKLRAGLPKDWRIGDKTGMSGRGNYNDIAVAWPAGRAPIVIATYFADSKLSDDDSNAVLAKVGAIAAKLADG